MSRHRFQYPTVCLMHHKPVDLLLFYFVFPQHFSDQFRHLAHRKFKDLLPVHINVELSAETALFHCQSVLTGQSPSFLSVGMGDGKKMLSGSAFQHRRPCSVPKQNAGIPIRPVRQMGEALRRHNQRRPILSRRKKNVRHIVGDHKSAAGRIDIEGRCALCADLPLYLTGRAGQYHIGGKGSHNDQFDLLRRDPRALYRPLRRLTGHIYGSLLLRNMALSYSRSLLYPGIVRLHQFRYPIIIHYVIRRVRTCSTNHC